MSEMSIKCRLDQVTKGLTWNADYTVGCIKLICDTQVRVSAVTFNICMPWRRCFFYWPLASSRQLRRSRTTGGLRRDRDHKRDQRSIACLVSPREMGSPKQGHAHRLSQSLVTAIRPLQADSAENQEKAAKSAYCDFVVAIKYCNHVRRSRIVQVLYPPRTRVCQRKFGRQAASRCLVLSLFYSNLGHI
jgi:hypothetical protein